MHYSSDLKLRQFAVNSFSYLKGYCRVFKAGLHDVLVSIEDIS